MVFEANGLKRLVQTSRVGVSKTVRVDAISKSDNGRTVSVTAESDVAPKGHSSVGQTLQNHQVIDLPLSFAGGRNASSFGGQLVAGVKRQQSGRYAELLQVSLSTALPPPDTGPATSRESPSPSFAGVQVETSGMSAEYGKSSGGVFNFVMKSGANQVHAVACSRARNEFFTPNLFPRIFSGSPRLAIAR